MPKAALQHGILELELEPARRADAAFGRKGAAEHGVTVRKTLAAEAAMNQFLDRQHGVEGALLVEHARAVDPGMRTQDHLVPVRGDVLVFPQYRRDRLVAHLF